MKKSKFIFAIMFFLIGGISLTANAQSSEVKKCQTAVDKHYESISDVKSSSVTPSASDREFWKEADKESCKIKSERRSDGHLKIYSVGNSRRKDKR